MTDQIVVAVGLSAWWRWAEATTIAGTVRDSLLLTGVLSALHLVGLTLVVGGMLVSSFRLLNVFLPGKPIQDVTAGISGGIVIGIVISMVTGLLLFLPRASVATQNRFFQLKMALLVAAIGALIALRRQIRRQASLTSKAVRVGGAITLLLWIGVAAAGCAYILLE